MPTEKELDKMIECLEKEKADLMRQKHEIGLKKMIEKLNDKIADAKKRNYKIKSIYISASFFTSLQMHFSGVMSELPTICAGYDEAKWQGYPLYSNWHLNFDEIQIAI